MPNATRPTTITCARCGAEKTVGRTGPIPTYCSASCRARVKDERARADGRYEAERTAAREKTRQQREVNARPCPYCTAPMVNPQRKQCGRPECKRAFNAERMRDWNRQYKAEHGQWYTRHRHGEAQRVYMRRRRQEIGHWRLLYPAAAAAADARRRALVQQARTDEVFAPLDIHVRDGWTCQLCHEPIDRAIAWPHPKSPSIDHIVPLSRGGAHALSNVQSAHLGCNSSKRDRDMEAAVTLLTRLAGQA